MRRCPKLAIGLEIQQHPELILARLRAAAAQALRSDDVVKRFADLGSHPGTADDKEARAFIKAEVDKWAELISVSGAKVD